MPKRTKRTDPHRPGAIVPSDYHYLLSYNLGTTDNGWPVPSYRVNCELDQQRAKAPEVRPHTLTCCVIGVQQAAPAVFGSTGKCGVCGASFIYGDLWVHAPTGAVVHLGHDCARKYQLLADRSEWELAHGRAKATAAREMQRQINAEEREAFLSDHPGLAEDLALGDVDSEHRGRAILGDLASRFTRYRSLTEKQIELARKLANEIRNPPAPRPEQVPCDAPTGRVEFEGKIVSAKLDDGYWGSSIKILVVVETEQGAWKAWGTAPSALLDAVHKEDHSMGTCDALRGRRVRLRATLQHGNEPSFAFMKRPSGRFVEAP